MKEIISHLRLVHFTLLVTSLGLVITIHQDLSFDLDQALIDIDHIHQVHEQLIEKNLHEYFMEVGEQTTGKKPKSQKTFYFQIDKKNEESFDKKNKEKSLLVGTRVNSWYLTEVLKKAENLFMRESCIWGEPDCEPKELTLTLFKKLWDILEQPQWITEPVHVSYESIEFNNPDIQIDEPDLLPGIFRIWNAGKRFEEVKSEFSLEASELYQTRFFSDNKTIAIAGKDKDGLWTVWIVDLESRNSLKRFNGFDLNLRIDTAPNKPILLIADQTQWGLLDLTDEIPEGSFQTFPEWTSTTKKKNREMFSNLINVHVPEASGKVYLQFRNYIFGMNTLTGKEISKKKMFRFPLGTFSPSGSSYIKRLGRNKIRIYDLERNEGNPKTYKFQPPPGLSLRSTNITSDGKKLIGIIGK